MELQEELHGFELGNLSISEYCAKLKTISDNLADVDHPIFEKTLVLQVLRCLPNDYSSLVNMIPIQTPFPSFSQTRSLLICEEKRQKKVRHTPSNQVLFSQHQTPPPTAHNPSIPSPSYPSHGGRGTTSWRGRGGWRGTRGGQRHYRPP